MDGSVRLLSMAMGLQARDHVLSGFDRADLVICVGYERVKYGPSRWNPDGTSRSSTSTASLPRSRLVPAGRGADRRHRRWLRRLLEAVEPQGINGRSGAERHASPGTLVNADLRQQLLQELGTFEHDDATVVKPQKAILDLRRALGPDDIVVSDVGAHKIWVARLYKAYEPNTVIISNGFASMGSRCRGRSRHRWCTRIDGRRPVRGRGAADERPELETAVRLRAKVTVVVWRDDGYGLIDWKQRNEFGGGSG